MRLFPAIDLYEGQAVRLLKGDYQQKTVYSDDPLSVALSFREVGARFLHLVDLEGARSGTTPNFDLISEILSCCGLMAEIGGGIRSPQVVDAYLRAGAMRVILGTAAIENPVFLRDMVKAYGDQIAVGVDIRDGCVATKGWTQSSGKAWQDFLRELQDLGVSAVICTDISRDGALKGPNLPLYTSIHETFPDLELVASGGMSCLDDLTVLRANNIPSAILGKALYEGKLSLKEALAACPQEDLP